MLTSAIFYYLACGDVEVTLYDCYGGQVSLVDMDVCDAAIIEALSKAALRWEDGLIPDSSQGSIIEVKIAHFS